MCPSIVGGRITAAVNNVDISIVFCTVVLEVITVTTERRFHFTVGQTEDKLKIATSNQR